MSRLTPLEERAEAALHMAKHPHGFCNCEAKWIMCRYDGLRCPPQPKPFANVIDQLIDRGRIYP